MDAPAFVNWFRQASPYINAHRGKVIVICFGGEAVEDGRFSSLIHDIALLNSLGIRLVLVHGARPQIDRRLALANIKTRTVAGLRITEEQALPFVQEAIGDVRIRVEARLSMGLANSPMHGARIRVVSGNFVAARPLGVHDGVDFSHTGDVRRIDTEALRTWLDRDAIVLLSPLGYSPTGEVFNLSAEVVATATAAALRADKLLLLYEGDDLIDASGSLIRQIGPTEAAHLARDQTLPDDVSRHLDQALQACRAGVRRIHLIKRQLDGGMLLELFSRDGVGAMISADNYDDLRAASIDDIGGLLALLRPLEQAGILVRRSRELLEIEIDRFILLERDGAIIGCAALYPFAHEAVGELACLAVHSDYRNSGRADILLQFIEQSARKQGLGRLFVLTTQTAHWFLERGFIAAAVGDLPVEKQALFNWQRLSKVFVKTL